MEDELSLLRAAAQVIESRKGERLVLVDLNESTIPTSYFLIAQGKSEVQVRAIARALLEDLPIDPDRREGVGEGRWVLLDYGEFVVHLFVEEARDFYDLEGLWPDCVVDDWRPAIG
ncbi:MAG: ribosome silencing factor [Candidatus Bipolaricaulota bacterium]